MCSFIACWQNLLAKNEIYFRHYNIKTRRAPPKAPRRIVRYIGMKPDMRRGGGPFVARASSGNKASAERVFCRRLIFLDQYGSCTSWKPCGKLKLVLKWLTSFFLAPRSSACACGRSLAKCSPSLEWDLKCCGFPQMRGVRRVLFLG